MILTRFLKAADHSKPQKYSLDFQIKTVGEKTPNNLLIVAPIPPTTKKQKIDDLKLTGQNVAQTDDKFKNRYALFSSPDNSIKFTADIMPYEAVSVQDFKMSDYDAASAIYKLNTSSERHINLESKKLKSLVDGLSFVNETNVFEIAKGLNQYVVDNLTYGNPIPDLYSSDEALNHDKVDCGGFSTLLIALLRIHRIPARIVCGFLLDQSTSIMHAWVEILMPDGNWIPADPTIENLLATRGTKRSGKFGYVGSDHLVLSDGSDINIKTPSQTFTIDILQNPEVLIPKDGSIKLQSELKVKT